MHDTDPQIRHWLSVHGRVRKKIQRTVILLASLAAIAAVQGFGRLQHLNEGYQFAREFTLQLRVGGPREEAAQLFYRRCQNAAPGCEEDRLFVRLEDIPEVGWEYGRFLNKNHPLGAFDVGYELGSASFALLLLFAPLALLLVIYLRVRTTARIATMLREKAVECGEVQQCLNSVFEERATEKLGERRWFHATVWILVILILALTPPMFLVATLTTRVINTEVAIDVQGNISLLPVVGLNERTRTVGADGVTLTIISALILAIMSLGWLAWWSVVQQLRPKDGPKVGTAGDIA